jgi:hypothetical protein
MLRKGLIQEQKIMLIGIVIRNIKPQISIEKNEQIERKRGDWLRKQTRSN